MGSAWSWKTRSSQYLMNLRAANELCPAFSFLASMRKFKRKTGFILLKFRPSRSHRLMETDMLMNLFAIALDAKGLYCMQTSNIMNPPVRTFKLCFKCQQRKLWNTSSVKSTNSRKISPVHRFNCSTVMSISFKSAPSRWWKKAEAFPTKASLLEDLSDNTRKWWISASVGAWWLKK